MAHTMTPSPVSWPARVTRWFKHRWMDDARRVFSATAAERLTAQVAQSERQHSGEIRLCIEAALPSSYLLRPDSMADLVRQRAIMQFAKLRVWDTQANNGVLIYLLLAERRIEVVADRGLNGLVSPSQWQDMVQRLNSQLHNQEFEAGLMQMIADVTHQLVAHYQENTGASNENELPNVPYIN